MEIACAAPDLEVLLADWLNAVIHEIATRRMVFGDFRGVIDRGHGARQGDRLARPSTPSQDDLNRYF